MLAVTAGLWRSIPAALVPEEDQGYDIALPFLPPAASQQRTSKVMLEIEKALADHPAIYETISFGGADPYTFMPKTNMGFSFVTLKPWDQRKEEHLKSPALVTEIDRKSTRLNSSH